MPLVVRKLDRVFQKKIKGTLFCQFFARQKKKA